MLQIIKGPYLQWPTQNSMTIMWETSEEGTSQVLWYETERIHSGLDGAFRTIEESERSRRSDDGVRIHRLTLDGLEPETDYHYRVQSEGADNTAGTPLLPLKTAVGADTPFSFAVFSETGGYGDDDLNHRLFHLIESWRPDFLLMVGDAVSRGSNYDDWERFFFGPARSLLHHIPFYLCPGNHEENASWFYDFVAFPEPRNYYSFDYGNAHFTALDSTRLVDYVDGAPVANEGLQPDGVQPMFLAQDLKSASTSTWKIVFFHYPPYVSGDYQVEEMRSLGPTLEDNGVDIVFNSHTIVYERSHPIKGGRLDETEGIVYVVAGGAGAKKDWFNPRRAWHTAEARPVPHFAFVTVAGRRLELKAIDFEGRVFDSMALVKTAAIT